MSRTSAQKAIHYVRAIYGQEDPADTLEEVLRQILQGMPTAGDTEIVHPALGTLSVRCRNLASPDAIYIAIGQGVPGESMSTVGIHVPTENDVEQPVPPIAGRAFRLSDAFCLIDDDDILVCTDGSFRIQSVSYYIAKLLEKGNAPNASQSMELVARLNHNKEEVLASGIKSLQIKSTAYQATSLLEGEKGGRLFTDGMGNLLLNLRSLFEENMLNEAEHEALVDHESEIVVDTTFHVKGGRKREEILVRALSDIANDAINDAPDGAEIIIHAKAGKVSSNDVVLKRLKSIKRLNQQNGFDHADAWDKLTEYRTELIAMHCWKI